MIDALIRWSLHNKLIVLSLAATLLAWGGWQTVRLPVDVLPDLTDTPALSGADIEGVLTRVRRNAMLQNRAVDADLIREALQAFHSPRGPEHELQWLAAILECSDLRYLPDEVRRVVESKGGFETLSRRFRELSDRID